MCTFMSETEQAQSQPSTIVAFAPERRERVKQILKARHTVRVEELKEEFGVSTATIRRDLHEPLSGHASSRLGFEECPQEQPEDQDKGDCRQHGGHRAFQMAVSHPPRSPHFSLRCRTWKYVRSGSVIK